MPWSVERGRLAAFPFYAFPSTSVPSQTKRYNLPPPFKKSRRASGRGEVQGAEARKKREKLLKKQ